MNIPQINNLVEIVLEGSANLHTPTSNCKADQIERIRSLAQFIFENPSYLNLTADIFRNCWKKSLFESSFHDIIELDRGFYQEDEFAIFVEVISDFYENSGDIQNDRGMVVEVFSELGLLNKYSNIGSVELKYHCKIHLKYGGIEFSTNPRNLDICARNLNEGDYIESKLSLTEDSSNDLEKMEKLSQLKSHLDALNNMHGHGHIIATFAFTNNKKKLDYYQKVWSKMIFLSINDFCSRFIN